MILKFAKFISFILNPLVLIAFLPFFLVYRSTNDVASAFYWTLYTFCFLVALGLFVFIAVRKHIFTDMDVSKREQRPLIFFISILWGLIYFGGLFIFEAPFVLLFVTWGVLVSVGIMSVINKRIKASIHVATLTALILTVIIGYGGYSFLLLLLIPLLIWSRLKTKRHTLAEAMTGGMMGSLLSLSVYSAYVAVKVLLHR